MGGHNSQLPVWIVTTPLKEAFHSASTDGSVVEFSPATREARVRFPVSAFFFAVSIISYIHVHL